MSSPACADGYDTPAQQREDSTTFIVAKVRDDHDVIVTVRVTVNCQADVSHSACHDDSRAE